MKNLSKILAGWLVITLSSSLFFFIEWRKSENALKNTSYTTNSGSETHVQNNFWNDILKIAALATEKDFYKKQREIDVILQDEKGKAENIRAFFANKVISSYEAGLLLPESNLYCRAGSGQVDGNFESYDAFMSSAGIIWTLTTTDKYDILVNNYLSSKEISSDSEFGKILVALTKENDTLLGLYKEKKSSEFKKAIFEINGGNSNDDILTMIFFEKNKLSKDDIINFLSICYDWKKHSINTDAIKAAFEKKLEIQN